MMTIQLTWATMIRRCASALFCIATLATPVWGADELIRIDFRNKIPGVLDAPVFNFDGVTRLDSSYVAELLVGDSPVSLAPVGDVLSFLSGTNTGYLPYDSAQERLVPLSPNAGEQIWFKLLIYKYVWHVPFGSLLGVGESKIYGMVVTNDVMPLVGLESFSLVPDRLRIRRQGDEVVVGWYYLGAQRYELQSATNLRPPIVWSPLFEWSFVGEAGQSFSVTNAVTNMLQLYRLERWEWP